MLKTLKTFYGFLLYRPYLFGFFVMLIIASNIFFSLNPYFYKLFVEKIPSMDYQILFNILVIFIGTRILGVVLDIIAFFIGDKILFRGSQSARETVFKKVQDLDFAFHTQKSTGSLISAFKRGDSAFFSFFMDIHNRMISTVVSFSVMAYFIFQLDSWIIILVTISLIITLIAGNFLVRNNVRKRVIFNEEEDKISGIITDNLINFETVKLFAKETWEAKRLNDSFVPWTQKLWGYGNSFRLIDGTMGTIINTSIFVILLLTINRAIGAKITIPDFVLITGYLSNFYPKLWDLIWSIRDIAKNYADIDKYFGLLDYKEEVLDPVNPIKKSHVDGIIEFKSVSHSYKEGTKNAAKNLNFVINKGESVAFVGRSGSGKTTITKLLMRFFDPCKGKITIDGIDIKNFTKSNLRSFFGVVPQEAVMFNNTIKYNIEYGAKGERSLKEVKKAAKLANIDKFIEKLPNKYETNVGERGIKLSGGQKQRMAIARMIMSNPDIIIFDEATSHLDSESEKLIQDAFWKASRGKTTLIVAHRLSTIAKADRIIVMEKGEIKEVGTHKDLISNKKSLYSHFWELQGKVE